MVAKGVPGCIVTTALAPGIQTHQLWLLLLTAVASACFLELPQLSLKTQCNAMPDEDCHIRLFCDIAAVYLLQGKSALHNHKG